MTGATTAEIDLAGAVTASPDEITPRAAMQDELLANDRWAWPVVYGWVCHRPLSDGLRLLAADYLDATPAEPCVPCGGTGVIAGPIPTPGYGIYRGTKQCWFCLGLKHDDPWRQAKAVSIRAQIALAQLQRQARLERAVQKTGQVTGGPRCRHTPPEQCNDCRDLHDCARVCTHWDRRDGETALRTWGLDRTGSQNGFLGHITLSAANWVKQHPAIVATYPITRVTLTATPELRYPAGGPDRGRAKIIGMPWVAAAKMTEIKGHRSDWAALNQMYAYALCAHYWPDITFVIETAPVPPIYWDAIDH